MSTTGDPRTRAALVTIVVLAVVLAPVVATVGVAAGERTSIPVNDSTDAPAPANVTIGSDVSQKVVGDGDHQVLVFDSSGTNADLATQCGYLYVSLDVSALPSGALTDGTDAKVALADGGGIDIPFFTKNQFSLEGTSVDRENGRIEIAIKDDGCNAGNASAVGIDAIELSKLNTSAGSPGPVTYQTGAVFVNGTEGGPQPSGSDVYGQALSADQYGLPPFQLVDDTPPEADAGEDQTVYAGEPVTFNGTGSTDNVGIASYAWDVNGDGTYDLHGATPSHAFNASGDYDVTLRVNDTSGNSATDATKIHVKEAPAPTVKDDAATVAAGSSVSIDVLANDAAARGQLDPSSVTVTSGPSAGTTAVNGTTGVITYTSDASGPGKDSFGYVVNDTNGTTSNEATVRIDVTAANEPPTVQPVADQTVAATATRTVTVNASDPDGDPVSLSLSTAPSFASLEDHGDGTGTITLQPGAGDAGEYPVTVTASDGNAAANASFTVTVPSATASPTATSGGGGGSSSGGSFGGSIGTTTGPSTATPTNATWNATQLGPNRIAVQVIGARANEPITVRLPPFTGDAGDGTDLAAFRVTPARDGDFRLEFVRAADPAGSTPAIPGSDVALAYYTANHSIADANVSSVTVGFRITKARLSAAGVDPASVQVYRYEDGHWTRYVTRQEKEDADAYYFTAEVPGFSQFAVGADRAAATDSTAAGTGSATAGQSPAANEGTTQAGPVQSQGGLNLGIVAAVGLLLLCLVVGFVASGPAYDWYRRR